MSARSSYEQVREFHESAGLMVREQPAAIGETETVFRLRLIAEEVGELVSAMVGFDEEGTRRVTAYLVVLFEGFARHLDPEGVDVAEVAKEAIDVHTVVSGALLHYGVDEDRVFELVHASNMAKVGGPRRRDGKQLKPEGWVPPDVAGALGLDVAA